MSELGKFCKSSKYFSGFAMQGTFCIDVKDFELAFEHYLHTGKNVLDDYAKIIYLRWDAEEYAKYDYGRDISIPLHIKQLKKLIDNKGFWNINYLCDKKSISLMKEYLTICENEIKYKKSYQYKREQACLYTSGPAIRKKVFKRDGRKCVKCGTSKNLTLDHIIPVSKNGKNKLENMQVLCRSCNSSKGDKCISKLT